MMFQLFAIVVVAAVPVGVPLVPDERGNTTGEEDPFQVGAGGLPTWALVLGLADGLGHQEFAGLVRLLQSLGRLVRVRQQPPVLAGPVLTKRDHPQRLGAVVDLGTVELVEPPHSHPQRRRGALRLNLLNGDRLELSAATMALAAPNPGVWSAPARRAPAQRATGLVGALCATLRLSFAVWMAGLVARHRVTCELLVLGVGDGTQSAGMFRSA